MFAPLYDPLPDKVRFYYDGEAAWIKKIVVMFHSFGFVKTATGFCVFVGKPMRLSPPAEEVATFFAKMLDHEYTTKDVFRKNFYKDWRKVRGYVVLK